MKPSRELPHDPGGAAITDEAVFVVRRVQLVSVLLAIGIAATCLVVVLWPTRPGPHHVRASYLVAYALAFGAFAAGMLYFVLVQSYRRRARDWSARVAANDPAIVPPLPAGTMLAVPCTYRPAPGRRVAGTLYLVQAGLIFEPHGQQPVMLPGVPARRGVPAGRLVIGPAHTIALEIAAIQLPALARMLYPAEPSALLVRWGGGESAAFSVTLAFQAERRLRAALDELMRADASRQLAERAAREHDH